MVTPRDLRLDECEEVFGIRLGEGTGGLVEDEDSRAGADGGGDLHELLLGSGEGAHGLADVEIHTDVGEQFRGAFFHFRAVDEEAESAGVATHAEVFGDGEVGAEGELLVNHSDAGGAGVGGGAEGFGLAVDEDLAGVSR